MGDENYNDYVEQYRPAGASIEPREIVAQEPVYVNYADPEPRRSGGGSGGGGGNSSFVMAIIAIVLAGVAVLTSMTLVLAIVTPPLFFLAAILSIIALARNPKWSPRHTPTMVCAIIALVISVIVGLPVTACSTSVASSIADRNSNSASVTSTDSGRSANAGTSTQQGGPSTSGGSAAAVAPEPAQPDDGYETVDLAAFFDELDANSARVSNAYVGKPIRFTGYVTSIDQGLFDKDKVTVLVSDKEPNGYLDVLGVSCEVRDEALRQVAYELNPGDVITVTGRFTLIDGEWINSFDVDDMSKK